MVVTVGLERKRHAQVRKSAGSEAPTKLNSLNLKRNDGVTSIALTEAGEGLSTMHASTLCLQLIWRRLPTKTLQVQHRYILKFCSISSYGSTSEMDISQKTLFAQNNNFFHLKKVSDSTFLTISSFVHPSSKGVM